MLQRQCRQQRKTDDDTEGYDDQRNDIFPGRPFLFEGEKQKERQQSGNRGTGNGQKDRIELHHRHARRRQRAAEDQHAHKPVDPSARRPVHVGNLSYPMQITSCVAPVIAPHLSPAQKQSDTIFGNCYGAWSGTDRDEQFRTGKNAER